jgi:hypothetical protein
MCSFGVEAMANRFFAFTFLALLVSIALTELGGLTLL